jgi:[acyl-carrier-protein] S-malonyltransferase
MGQIAFLFPGQGAQVPGMGSDFYDNNPYARAVFDKLERLRPGTLAQCFSGTPEELAQTNNTQPCLFACELAAAETLRKSGVTPSCVAGFSLGEIAALTYSGAVSLEEGFRLVQLRGDLMQKDAETADTAMAAILKLSGDEVEALCARFEGAYPVNYNCPGQTTVACKRDVLLPFSAAVKEAGGRALPLNVRGGFHSVFMKNAAAAFGAELQTAAFQDFAIPLYSNYTALPYDRNPAELLSKQIENPVRWELLIRHMLANGVDTFVELGVGTILSGMVKKIVATEENPNLKPRHIVQVTTQDQLRAVIKELRLC